jgi:hypothetical protein
MRGEEMAEMPVARVSVRFEAARELCPACEERFVVEGYGHCSDCIQIGKLLEAKRMLERLDVGVVPFDALEPSSSLAVFRGVGIALALEAIAALVLIGGWHVGKWFIGFLLAHS